MPENRTRVPDNFVGVVTGRQVHGLVISRLVFGLIVVGFGVIFLLDELGVVNASTILRYWAVLPLGYGLMRLTGLWCRQHLVGVINYSPMHSGLLTGAMTKERVANFPEDDFRKRAKNYQEPLLSRNLGIAELLKTVGARHGVSAGVIAIAWTLCNTAITAAIVGVRSPEQVDGVWPAARFRLSKEEYDEINIYLNAHPATA